MDNDGFGLTTPAPPPRGGSYSQWVNRAITLARGTDRRIVSLFESTVPEPRAALRSTVARLIEPDFGSSYVSAFSGGNPIVLDILAARYGVTRERVLCTTGATACLSLLFRAYGGPDAHVLIETPGFDLFADLAVDRRTAVTHFSRCRPDYAIDPDEVAALIRPNTRMILLSNLHNPSGMPLDHGVLCRLAELAERRDVLLVVDEVYGDYADASVRPCAAAAISPAVVSVSSLTKIYGLATLRCGWVVGAQRVIDRLRSFDARLEFGRSNLAHAVAAEVLRDPAPFERYTHDIVSRAHPVVEGWLRQMDAEGLMTGDLPDAGCIAFPRLVGIDDTEAFAEALIREHGIIVAPGEYFGAAGHVRIGFALPIEQLAPALAGLGDALRTARDEATGRSDRVAAC